MLKKIMLRQQWLLQKGIIYYYITGFIKRKAHSGDPLPVSDKYESSVKPIAK